MEEFKKLQGIKLTTKMKKKRTKKKAKRYTSPYYGFNFYGHEHNTEGESGGGEGAQRALRGVVGLLEGVWVTLTNSTSLKFSLNFFTHLVIFIPHNAP